MNQNNTDSPKPHRFLERFSESRYFTISLLFHVLLVIVAGTIVLVQRHTETDEGMAGEVLPPNEVQPRQETVTEETGPTEKNVTVMVPNTETPKPSQPTPNNPPTPIPIRIPVIFSEKGPVSLPGQPTVDDSALANLVVPGVDAKELGLRFMKDGATGRVMFKGKSGPQPTIVTEDAVIKGLKWLRDHQNEDGSWGEKNKAAMTGLAMLCFLGHGELPDSSKEFGLAVNRGVQWLVDGGTTYEGRLSMTKGNWGADNTGVYEHAIATYALGEYYTLSADQRVLEVLKRAVAFIVAGQGPDGGWTYRYDKTQGDTSVSGWQVQALKAAHLTKLNLPGVDGALDQAMKNFDRVQGPNGGYGYRGPEDRYSLTGVGLLSELFWREKRDKDLHRSVDFILNKTEKELPLRYQGEHGDLYAWYYHGQALLMYGGGAWSNWNRHFSNEIVQAQGPSGDWPPMKAAGVGNLQNAQSLNGQVYRTTFCVLMLEVYYRYLPVNRTETGPALPKMAAR